MNQELILRDKETHTQKPPGFIHGPNDDLGLKPGQGLGKLLDPPYSYR